MRSLNRSTKRAVNDIPRVTRLVGVYVETDGVRATVDVGGGRIPADFAGYLPEVNESVWVLFVGATAMILGPTVMKPSDGVVSGAPSGNLVPVTTDAGSFTLPYASGLTLSAGQEVKLGAWSGGGFVYAVKSTTPPRPAPPPKPALAVYAPRLRSAVFTAIDSGSYRLGNGWWTSEVWASTGNAGAWFYGSKIVDTIPNSADIQSVEIYINARQITGYPPNLGYHDSGSKPGGSVSFVASTPIGVGNGWVALPTSFGDFLKANLGGVGADRGGYSIFRSVAQDGSSGALRINWIS